MRKNISKKRLNNRRRRVKKTRRHNMKGGTSLAPKRNVKKIVLYGLSANPPTKAHKNIIEQLADVYDAVFVWASTNRNKLDKSHKDYDPMYKDEKTRSEFLIDVLDSSSKIKVDYYTNDDGSTFAKYNDAYTGISVKKFIDANLVSTDTINRDGNNFKTFKLNEEAFLQGDVDFLKKCGITETDIVELWVCFGLDVVRDTPTWTPNNAFLTKATGIVMITREGESVGNGLFSKVYDKPVLDLSMTKPIYRFKMPFLDCTTIDKDTKQFIKKDLKFTIENFPQLFADTDMHKLAQDLINASYTHFDLITKEKPALTEEKPALTEEKPALTEEKPALTEEKKRDNFLEWLKTVDTVDNKFSLLIEESLITLAKEFAEASSTKVRKLAIQIGLDLEGEKTDSLQTQLKSLVNDKIIDSIISTYGNPTIEEQLAIIRKKEPEFLQTVETQLKNKVLEIMK